MESRGDRYCYRCSHLTSDELSDKSESMEKTLNEWTKAVENARDKYYPLNSFTNKQLCLLRKELYEPQKLTSGVKFLFTSLLPCTAESDIIRAINETRKQQQKCLTTFSDASSHDHSAPSSTKKITHISSKKTRQALELKQLVKSSALKPNELDLFINMTESHRTKPSLTLLIILRNRGKSEPKLSIMLEQYTDIRLQLMQTTKREEINREINELLSKQSSEYFLKETEDEADKADSDESVSRPIKVPVKPPTSSVDLSLSRYYYYYYLVS